MTTRHLLLNYSRDWYNLAGSPEPYVRQIGTAALSVQELEDLFLQWLNRWNNKECAWFEILYIEDGVVTFYRTRQHPLKEKVILNPEARKGRSTSGKKASLSSWPDMLISEAGMANIINTTATAQHLEF